MVPRLRKLTYEENLEKLGMPKLKEWREIGDLIEMYRMMNKME